MKKHSFRFALTVFAAVCAALSAVFLIYVFATVSEYDKVQPERAVEAEIRRLSAAAADGSLAAELDFSPVSGKYETRDMDELRFEYTERLKGDMSFSQIAAESAELTRAYTLSSDGRDVGKLVLEGKSPRTRLFFFSMADWSVKSFTPRIANTVYNLKVYCPEETSVLINGISPEKSEADYSEDIPSYQINGLLAPPEIKYTRSDGTPVSYSAENNVITPLLYNYRIELPKGIEVSVNGKKATGEPSGGMLVYSVRQMTEPSMLLTDGSGEIYIYRGQSRIPVCSYSVTVPEYCDVSVAGISAEGLGSAESADDPDARQLLKLTGVVLPKLKKYDFALFADSVPVTVSSGGSQREYLLENGGALEISSFNQEDALPDDVAAEIDVLEAAKTWSRLMTDDLGGEQRGLDKAAAYLVPDSDYYRYAKEWVNSIDITFTSDHTIDSFSGERVSGYVRYSEDCFSCSVYFEKNMSLYFEDRYVGARTDIFNSKMYFLRIEDGSWRIALMHDDLTEAGENDER